MKQLMMVFGFVMAMSFFAQANTKSLGSPKAKQGGTINLNLEAEPPTLNPITQTDLYARVVREFVVETLMTRNEETYEWEPGLAKSMKISPDGKTYTFELREDATWHDGKPVTVEDVKFSFDVIFDSTYNLAPLRPYYEGIAGVEIVDKKTVKISTKNKNFNNEESAAGLKIYPKHIYGDAAKGVKMNKEMWGSGPYILDKWEKGQRITIKKNPNWWGLKDPFYKNQHNYEKIVFRFVKENNVALEMLKKGDLDHMPFNTETFATKTEGPMWGKTVMKYKVQNLAPKSYGFIGWNFRNDLFKDKDVRVALGHLLNREEMNKKFRYGMSLLATGPWYQQSDYASKKIKPIPFDIQKSLALFKKAGWQDTDKDGILDKMINGKKMNMSFTLLTANQDTMKYWTMFKEDAKKAGVDVNVRFVEWNSFIKLVEEGNFDAVAMGWGGGSIDLDPKQIWHSDSAVKGGSNFIAYKNPAVDKLIDEAREELDKKKRIPKMQKIYELIAEDAPYAFLFNDKFLLYGTTSRVKKVKDTYKYDVGSNYWWLE